MDEKKQQAMPAGQKPFGIVFFAVLAVIGIFLMAGKKEATLSEREQRMLAGCPDLTVKSYLSGDYQTEYEAYLADQMPGRDYLYSRYQEGKYLIGNRFFGDYLAGEDGSVLALAKPWKKEYRTNLAQFLATLSKEMPGGAKVVMLAPEASQVMTGWGPKGGYAGDQSVDYEAFCKELKAATGTGEAWTVTNALKALQAKSDTPLYYKGDHHWNTHGAYVAAGEILRLLGKQICDEDYNWYVVKDDFMGTTASGSGLFGSGDMIELCEPKDFRYTVKYVQEDRKETTCFVPEKLSEMQPYEVFFGGNFGELDIRTEAYAEGTLLVVKDSFANCLLPMLLPHYRQIIVVDPRYFTGDWELLLESLKDDPVQCDILWMYRQNTLADLDVADLLSDITYK